MKIQSIGTQLISPYLFSKFVIGLSIYALVAIGGFSLSPQNAHAQANDFPNKPVKLIVPFPPGGTSDVMGRMIADELSKILKQPFVVENVGGAGGVIGAERGARANPDGYTLTLTGVGSNAVAHGLDSAIKYNSNTDFVHISQIHHGPNLLVVNAQQPFKTLKELIDYAKAYPGRLDYGFTHAASGHMAMELFKQTATVCKTADKSTCQNLAMVGIPYRGGGPMMAAVLGNEIPMMFINQDVAIQHVKAGKLRAIAVSSLQRNPLYPDVPTVAESGYPGFQALSWSGLSAPKGTPKAIVDKLEIAMAQAMGSPAIKARMEGQGFVVPPQGSKVYTDFVKAEIDSWSKVIKTAGIKAQ
jgi:tripartite-type tricarboxylate transporter receptor subunit TctC